MMDLREATACLDEYRSSLAFICVMLRRKVDNGEFSEAIGKLNDGLMETLEAQVKEAGILSILILEKMNATHELALVFPDEWADIWTALGQLRVATDTAAEVKSEYLRKIAANTAEVTESPSAKLIREFRARMSKPRAGNSTSGSPEQAG
jgi:hypothetical protein